MRGCQECPQSACASKAHLDNPIAANYSRLFNYLARSWQARGADGSTLGLEGYEGFFILIELEDL
jgi:hypothetical protein